MEVSYQPTDSVDLGWRWLKKPTYWCRPNYWIKFYPSITCHHCRMFLDHTPKVLPFSSIEIPSIYRRELNFMVPLLSNRIRHRSSLLAYRWSLFFNRKPPSVCSKPVLALSTKRTRPFGIRVIISTNGCFYKKSSGKSWSQKCTCPSGSYDMCCGKRPVCHLEKACWK